MQSQILQINRVHWCFSVEKNSFHSI